MYVEYYCWVYLRNKNSSKEKFVLQNCLSVVKVTMRNKFILAHRSNKDSPCWYECHCPDDEYSGHSLGPGTAVSCLQWLYHRLVPLQGNHHQGQCRGVDHTHLHVRCQLACKEIDRLSNQFAIGSYAKSIRNTLCKALRVLLGAVYILFLLVNSIIRLE